MEAIDITRQVGEAVRKHQWENGVLFVFCPHTTCALACNEFESFIKEDFEKFFSELREKKWRHDEVDGNADAHLKQLAFGGNLFFFVEAGKLQKGIWQHVLLLEGDGPRKREVWLKFLPSK